MKKRAHNEETKKEYRRIKTTIFYDGKRARTRVTSNQSERESGKEKDGCNGICMSSDQFGPWDSQHSHRLDSSF